MSNANSARRAGRVATSVESLESRTLFVATPGPSFSAVVSYVQSTAASQLRLAQHAEASNASLSSARAAATKAAADGKALLAADQAAIKAAAGNPAANEVARQKLAQDRIAVKASVLAARGNLKTLQTQSKSNGAALKAALKSDRAALNNQLASSDGRARSAVQKLLGDWRLIQVGSALTGDDLQALADDLKAAADGATQPSAESVATLRDHALQALADGTLGDDEADALLVDLKNVFLTADVSEAEADKIVADTENIINKIDIGPAELTKIVGDVQETLAAFNGI